MMDSNWLWQIFFRPCPSKRRTIRKSDAASAPLTSPLSPWPRSLCVTHAHAHAHAHTHTHTHTVRVMCVVTDSRAVTWLGSSQDVISLSGRLNGGQWPRSSSCLPGFVRWIKVKNWGNEGCKKISICIDIMILYFVILYQFWKNTIDF